MTDADRIEETARTLLLAARQAGKFVTGDDRVAEEVAAELLGFAPASLANMRRDGSGPAWYRVGGAGHKVSYRALDLAAWLESRRIEHGRVIEPN